MYSVMEGDRKEEEVEGVCRRGREDEGGGGHM